MICFLAILTLLPGCAGMKEIDEAAYILAMGIDRGSGRNIIVSVAVGNAAAGGQAPGSAGGNPAKAMRVYAAAAPTIFTALSIINTVVERQLTPTHLKLVIFSEGLARQGVREQLDVLTRWHQFRPNLYLAVTPGPARAAVESIVPSFENNPAKFLELMILTQGFVGFTPSGQLFKFINAYKTKGAPIALLVAPRTNKSALAATRTGIPDTETNLNVAGDPGDLTAGRAPVAGEGPLQFMGTAVFDRDRMAGSLNGNESLAMSIMRGELRRAFITVPDPRISGRPIQVELSQIKRPKVSVKRTAGGVGIREEIYLQAEIAGVQSEMTYEMPSRLHLAERAVARWVREKCLKAFAKTRALGADVFGFGDKARWLVPDWPAWEKTDWRAEFRASQLALKILVHIDRTGLVIEKNAVQEE